MFDDYPAGALSHMLEDERRQEQQDAIEAREQILLSQYRSHCRALAVKAAKDYALANGEDYYQEFGPDGDTESWHGWLREDAADTRNADLHRAMVLLINAEEDFTLYAWAEAEAARQVPRRQAA